MTRMSTPASRRCGADRYQLFLAIEREAKPPQLPAARPDEYEKPIGIIELEVFWRGLGEAKFGVGQGHVGYDEKTGVQPEYVPQFWRLTLVRADPGWRIKPLGVNDFRGSGRISLG